MKLNKNTILITGATAGIGRALTETFLKLDNRIIAVGRNATKLSELGVLDDKIIPYQCDISDKEELEKMVEFVKKGFPDLNMLINNAGIQYNYHFSEENEIINKIEHEVEINFLAPIRLIAMLLPTLEQNSNSSIVNVSSGLALVPKMDAPIYCGTKGGIHIFTKSLRYQVEDKVKVFEIIPALVDTAMVAGRGKGKISPQQLVDEFINAFKKNRFEVNIGKVKLLRFVNRISPRLADRIMKG